MTKKGSALMQVMVVGLIVAAFSVLMLRYAITRSANLSRTERILESQIVADSCLDQYMALWAESELYGQPIANNAMNCIYYTSTGTLSNITMTTTIGTNNVNNKLSIVKFTVPVS